MKLSETLETIREWSEVARGIPDTVVSEAGPIARTLAHNMSRVASELEDYFANGGDDFAWNKSNEKLKITERGWPGHFIAAESCLFRRNTLIEYGRYKVIVSTVGEYINPLTRKMDAIGHERWYETMAFVGGEYNGYIDADAGKAVKFTSECGMYARDIDELALKYGLVDNAANRMHDNVVKEISTILLEGRLEVIG